MASGCALTVTVRCNGVERILTGRRAIIVRELMGESLRLDDLEWGKLIINMRPGRVGFTIENSRKDIEY